MAHKSKDARAQQHPSTPTTEQPHPRKMMGAHFGPERISGAWGDRPREAESQPGKAALRVAIQRVADLGSSAMRKEGADSFDAEGCFREALELTLILREIEAQEFEARSHAEARKTRGARS